MDKTFKLILTLFIVIIMSGIYLWGGAYLDWKKENAQVLQEVYSDLGTNYQIGKYHKVNSICNKDEKIGCLNGEIKGIKMTGTEEGYLYIYLYRSETKGRKSNEELRVLGYNYGPF